MFLNYLMGKRKIKFAFSFLLLVLSFKLFGVNIEGVPILKLNRTSGYASSSGEYSESASVSYDGIELVAGFGFGKGKTVQSDLGYSIVLDPGAPIGVVKQSMQGILLLRTVGSENGTELFLNPGIEFARYTAPISYTRRGYKEGSVVEFTLGTQCRFASVVALNITATVMSFPSSAAAFRAGSIKMGIEMLM